MIKVFKQKGLWQSHERKSNNRQYDLMVSKRKLYQIVTEYSDGATGLEPNF